MLLGGYRELFVAIATSAASLTGLLFVVVTVADRLKGSSGPEVVHEVKAAAALLAFINALAVSLFGLVPGTNVGYPAFVVGIVGLLFSLAAVRSLLRSGSQGSAKRVPPRQLVLALFVAAAFAAEIVMGAELLRHPASTAWLQGVSYILIAALLAGVARAWEIVGGRDAGIFASLAVLTERDKAAGEPTE